MDKVCSPLAEGINLWKDLSIIMHAIKTHGLKLFLCLSRCARRMQVTVCESEAVKKMTVIFKLFVTHHACLKLNSGEKEEIFGWRAIKFQAGLDLNRGLALWRYVVWTKHAAPSSIKWSVQRSIYFSKGSWNKRQTAFPSWEKKWRWWRSMNTSVLIWTTDWRCNTDVYKKG